MGSYIYHILALDWETSGINRQNMDLSKDYQPVSGGFIVVDSKTLTPIEELYIELKWDGVSLWEDEAEKIHKLSKEYLEENGLTREEAACSLANFIIKYWPDPTKPITCLGHNVHFDIMFLKNLLEPFEIMPKVTSRNIDTFSVGFVTLGTYDSNELFESTGVIDKRKKIHNALDDARMALSSARVLRKTFRKGVNSLKQMRAK